MCGKLEKHRRRPGEGDAIGIPSQNDQQGSQIDPSSVFSGQRNGGTLTSSVSIGDLPEQLTGLYTLQNNFRNRHNQDAQPHTDRAIVRSRSTEVPPQVPPLAVHRAVGASEVVSILPLPTSPEHVIDDSRWQRGEGGDGELHPKVLGLARQ